MNTALQWSGAVFGVIGSFLLATHGRWSRYGWLAYLAANITMGAFAAAIGAYGLLAQQLCFSATTMLGLHRSGWLTRLRVTLTAPAADADRSHPRQTAQP
jgi:hypothetical protein